ncbi:MAG: hypothetical protein LAO51_17750, partial [Acidobacteriia bacterium]|nr:hypothetical protein [Terriglobia bacterium]
MYTARRTLVACVAMATVLSALCAAEVKDKPKDLGLVEKAGTHLGQLEITVTGPRETASRLTAADFEVQVGKQSIENFHLDPLCVADPSTTLARPASYVFYFDQRHLTPSGRQRALAVVREMVSRLILDGSRGMVVSSAKKLKVFTQFTSRPEEILKAIEDLEHDPDQVDPSPIEEEMRVEEIRSAIDNKDGSTDDDGDGRCRGTFIGHDEQNDAEAAADRRAGGPPSSAARKDVTSVAVLLAKRYNQDEMAAAREDFLRIAGVLRRLGGVEAPKVFLYFSDTMRRNAGEHFVRMLPPGAFVFSRISRAGKVGGGSVSTVSENGAFASHWGETAGSEGAYEEVLVESAAQNVRFYPVQAEGLTFSSPRGQDAQDTLAS